MDADGKQAEVPPDGEPKVKRGAAEYHFRHMMTPEQQSDAYVESFEKLCPSNEQKKTVVKKARDAGYC